MKIYIVLKDGEPIKQGDVQPEIWDEYEESKDESLYYSGMEIAFISAEKEIIEIYKEECEQLFEGTFSVGELHLVLDEKDWN